VHVLRDTLVVVACLDVLACDTMLMIRYTSSSYLNMITPTQITGLRWTDQESNHGIIVAWTWFVCSCAGVALR